MSEKYYSISPYNNSMIFIDPDGKGIYFIAGANNDSDGWGYISRFDFILTKSGLNNFIRVNASGDKIHDMVFSADYRNSETKMNSTAGGMFGGSIYYETKASDDKQYNVALSGIIEYLESNPIKKGEQLNLAGYSYGAVMHAHLAIDLVEEAAKKLIGNGV